MHWEGALVVYSDAKYSFFSRNDVRLLSREKQGIIQQRSQVGRTPHTLKVPGCSYGKERSITLRLSRKHKKKRSLPGDYISSAARVLQLLVARSYRAPLA
eukprot:1968-Eustigmatos_ZCMA.PRE.1